MSWYLLAHLMAGIFMSDVFAGNQTANRLTEAQYAVCFSALLTVSKEHEVSADWIQSNLIPTLVSKPSLRVLSVGSGTGDFDSMILKQLVKSGAKHVDYTCVEPSSKHVSQLSEKLSQEGPGISLHILNSPFQEARVKGPFDLVLFAHSLYYFEDRRQAIELAFSLAPEGQVLFVHQTPFGIAQIQRKFMQRLTGRTDEMFTSEDLLAILRARHIPYFQQDLPTTLDVTECLQGSCQGKHLLNFFLESDLETISGQDLQTLTDFVRDLAPRDSNGRHQLLHPVSIIIGSLDPSRLPVHGMVKGILSNAVRQ
jgi:SAM-dependent methyltransferase